MSGFISTQMISILDFTQGAGVFCVIFLPSTLMSAHYDGEIEAIHLALHQLSVCLYTPDKAVILSDSSSALQALVSNQDKQSSRVQDYRELLSRIPTKVVFQWEPSHCGLWGNEMADLLAKRRMDILQRSTRDLPLHLAKLEIHRIYKKCFQDVWSCLGLSSCCCCG
ncbi:RNase H domain-containing protein [Trichonephila clavipes]|nr:RNase H domain-containing protein [Trichonephila clavipes]